MSDTGEARGWITITVPYEEGEGPRRDGAGTSTDVEGRSWLRVWRGGREVSVRVTDIHTAVAQAWPIGREHTDHAKRLAEIGEAIGERLPLSPCDGAFLWEQFRAASEALSAAGIRDDGRALAERVKALAGKAAPKRCDDCGGTDAPHGHRFGCGLEPEDPDVLAAVERCRRGEHRKAGETMPGSCADCGVDWGDIDAEDEPSTGLDVAMAGDEDGMRALVGLPPAELTPAR